jgi:hypothetical protein
MVIRDETFPCVLGKTMLWVKNLCGHYVDKPCATNKHGPRLDTMLPGMYRDAKHRIEQPVNKKKAIEMCSWTPLYVRRRPKQLQGMLWGIG